MENRSGIEEKLRLENQFKSGANWFFWIAGLSIINSIIILSGGGWGFIVGLGITQIIDGIAHQIGPFGKAIALVLNVFIAGIFVFFGIFARKRHLWSFIVGMILYAFDGLIFLLVGDILGIGFHVLALYFIFAGLRASKKLAELENYESSPPSEAPLAFDDEPALPSASEPGREPDEYEK